MSIKYITPILIQNNFYVEELIKTIHADIDYAKQKLADYNKTDEYFNS